MNWQEILDDIDDEQAILFVGPEFVRLGGQSLGQHVREQLHRQFPDQILHHYQRDGIFLFRDDDAKVKAQKQVKRLYRQLPPDEALLQRIAAIPFHLIIALTPDLFCAIPLNSADYSPIFTISARAKAPKVCPSPNVANRLFTTSSGRSTTMNHSYWTTKTCST